MFLGVLEEVERSYWCVRSFGTWLLLTWPAGRMDIHCETTYTKHPIMQTHSIHTSMGEIQIRVYIVVTHWRHVKHISIETFIKNYSVQSFQEITEMYLKEPMSFKLRATNRVGKY